MILNAQAYKLVPLIHIPPPTTVNILTVVDNRSLFFSRKTIYTIYQETKCLTFCLFVAIFALQLLKKYWN